MQGPRRGGAAQSASRSHRCPGLSALYRQIEDRLDRLPGVRGSGLALYNPLTDNWGELILVAGHPLRKLSDEAGASWDRVSANYLQNSWHADLARTRTSPRPTTKPPRRSPSSMRPS